MAEMDIYMRRRLVALGGLVLFFIFFVLLVKSCGGDDEPSTLGQVPTGASGEEGTAALTEDQFIQQADQVCAQSNAAVGALDPADTGATQEEFQITRQELSQLNSLEADTEELSSSISKFLNDLGAVVDALKDKADAVESGDVAAQDSAQVAIDTAEVDARTAGERAGFSDCGQFLDAGEEPTGNAGTDPAADPAAVPTDPAAVPTDPGTVPTDPGTVPTDPGTTPTDPGTDPGTGGGGVTP